MSLDRAAQIVKFLPLGSMKLELYEHFCGMFNLYDDIKLKDKFTVDCGYYLTK